jgi:C-terminal processing protease CtpA/Prc
LVAGAAADIGSGSGAQDSDPNFHGVDWDAKVAEAKQKIEKTTSMNMALSHIAAALDTLNDTHTFFLPPEHSYRHEYGFQYQMVGDRCFVSQVRPKSNAEAKGVKPGDEILTINGYDVNRDDLWKVQYVFSILRPQPVLQLGLKDPLGVQRQVEVAAKIRDRTKIADMTPGNGGNNFYDLVREGEDQEHLMRARFGEFGDELMVIKIPEFNFSAVEIGDMIGKARKHQALIVGLRGNPGGSVDTLRRLRNGSDERTPSPRWRNPFTIRSPEKWLYWWMRSRPPPQSCSQELCNSRSEGS